MGNPVVSVIIPCYNAEKYLGQCIGSILGQTLKDIELICVDDGSADSTVELLKGFQQKDARVSVLQQKNAGAGAARNKGLDCARGKYVSFLDADDFFEPDMLEKAVASAEKYEADYVVFHSDRYYSGEDRYEAVPWSVCEADLPPYMPFSYRQLTGNIFLTFVGWAWDKLFRRDFVQKHALRFQEQRTTNDMLFVFSALICAGRIAVVPDILAHQRRGGRESLSVTRERSWSCFYDALLALRERLVQENVFWELEKDFINYALHFSLWHLNSLAEPARTDLETQLREAWFQELGICGKPETYFYIRNEYAQFRQILGRSAPVKVPRSEREPVSSGAGEAIPQVYLKDIAPAEDACDAAAVWVQLDHLRNRLMTNEQTWKTYKNDYWKIKYKYSTQAVKQLPETVSGLYFQRLCRELNRAQQLGQMSKAAFSRREWKAVQSMIRRSEGRISMVRSLFIVRWISPYIPNGFKQKLVQILKKEREEK